MSNPVNPKWHLEEAVKTLLDTLPSCPEGYYGHWDAGSEDTDSAVMALRKMLKYPDKRMADE
jgi:hypothetical protein